MSDQPVPTFGRVVQLLRELGCSELPAKPGVLALAHETSGAEFLFRDRSPDSLARETELANLRVQLVTRGVLTEVALDALLYPKPVPAGAVSA